MAEQADHLETRFSTT